MSSHPALAFGTDRLPTLTGSRLRLRWLEVSDVPALFALGSHAEVSRYWSRPPMQSVSEAEALLEDVRRQHRARTLFQWGIARLTDDVLLGCCTLHQVEWGHRRAEVGYSLRREFWGEGFMTEALRVLFDFSFGPVGLHRLEADVDPRNERSLRLLERLRFRREGLLRERYHVGGEIQDSVLLGLLARDWGQVATPLPEPS